MSDLLTISIKDLPEELRDEIMPYIISNREIPDELIKRIILQVAKEPSKEEREKIINDIIETEKLLCHGLDIYLNQTQDLFLSFHIPELKGSAIKMYNACSKFIQAYNKMEAEHGECLNKPKS